MPRNGACATVVRAAGTGGAPPVSLPATAGSGSLTVTVRNDGSTAIANATTTGTDWASAVRANPRPIRGSAQPRARVNIPTAAAKPNALGLAIVESATPGFQAKKA